jgi:hypothetical protein
MLNTAASMAVVAEPSLPPSFSLHLAALASPDDVGFSYEVSGKARRLCLSDPSLIQEPFSRTLNRTRST